MTDERDSAGRILVVDDVDDLRRLVGIALRRAGFNVLEAASGEEALETVRTSAVDLVVLDMGLPGMSGTEVIRALRKRPETITLPVLLMTGSGTSESVVENLDAGANDFLAKPVRLDELVARVRAHMRSNEAWSGLVEDELRVRSSVVSALSRMTLSAEPEAAAEAIVDELARRTDSPFISVLQLVSGNRLQPLATYNRGDRLRRGGPPVRAHASVMTKAREGPWAERAPVGGPGAADGPSSLAGIALLAGAPIYAGGAVVGVLNIGAGGAGFTPSPAEQAKLMAAAIDYASILSAVAGSALADRRHVAEVRSKLRRDLSAQAFYPVFQPIVALQTREVVGFEALSRFTDGTAPDVRFAEAAVLGMGDEFELAAIDAALAEATKLPEGKFLTLNVSPAVTLSAGKRLRRKLGGSSRRLVLELTEHEPIDDYAPLRNAIAALGNVQIAVDDAGAGYASMRHILELRPAFAKLDVSLVRGIDGDELRQAMAAGLQHYALRTGCLVVAEGVETQEEASALQGLGVDLGQGYLFGRPEPLTA